MKKIVYLCLKALLCVSLFIALHFFCLNQTKGFRYYYLLSNLPNDERWEFPPLSVDEKKNVDALLAQEFTFLGSGGWCFAFLGADGTTVLKFYKHTHLRLDKVMKRFSFKKLISKSDPLPKDAYYFQEFNFKSCALLYQHAKELTGILYAHLNKTENLLPQVVLIDNIGVRHTIDLDKTEFILQQKADLLIPHLQKQMASHNVEGAKNSIDALLNCIVKLYDKGIRDHDSSIRNNYGFTEEGAIALDISSFGPDDSLKDPAVQKVELRRKTHRLERWLKKYHLELYHYYEQRINQI